jgi:radical SAM protein with 4Fe4S-binding SPASM domain
MKIRVMKPKIITFEVTRHCKYHCSHCRAGMIENKNSDLTTSECKKILKGIAKYTKCIIVFSGGEPMERKDIYSLVGYCASLKLKPILATCGYLLNEKTIEKLKKNKLTAFAFSLDGATAQTHDFLRQAEGSFEQILNAAKIAKQFKIRFQVNTTITKYNFGEINSIAELAESMGAVSFNPFILVPSPITKNCEEMLLDAVEYETLLNQILELKIKSKIKISVTCGPTFARITQQSDAEKRLHVADGCLGGDGLGFITYKGDVQTCPFLNISAGNLVKEKYNFAAIWQNSEFLNKIRDRSALTGHCFSCDFRDLCGGCRARAFAASGDLLSSDPACTYRTND